MKWSSKYPEPTIGKTYGRLTVISDYRENYRNVDDKVTVQCDCGKIKDVRIGHLIYDATHSCGCLHDENVGRARKFAPMQAGDRYNHLIVIESLGIDKTSASSAQMIKVKCDLCGNETILQEANLRKAVSCGCYQRSQEKSRKAMKTKERKRQAFFDSLIGQAFNGYIIQHIDQQKETKTYRYDIECPNGHNLVLETKRGVERFIATKLEHACWCELENPIDQLRKKRGLRFDDIARGMGVSRARAQQIHMKIKKEIDWVKHATDKDAFINDLVYYKTYVRYLTALGSSANELKDLIAQKESGI